MMDRSEQIKLCVGYYWIMRMKFDTLMLFFLVTLFMYIRNRRRGNSLIGRRMNTLPLSRDALDSIIGLGGDRNCIRELRMSLNAFANLCELLQVQGGLDEDGHVGICEQVATFLIILAHHTKNRSVHVRFYRSGETVSRYFHKVLCSVLRVQSILFAKADPVPEDCIDPRWKWFKGCLGALDGTYIDVTVSRIDKPRYRTRKSRISTNVLGVCNRNMNFVYVLSGWEGSASDSRVLRDAIIRRNGLKIPVGSYYLVDAGYTNGRGFLSPYRNVRYHVNEWAQSQRAPQNRLELFNKRHSSARSVIERCFGLLRKRWEILRSPSCYPIRIQNHIIIACCLLHNFIRMNMDVDPEEDAPLSPEHIPLGDDTIVDEAHTIDVVESSNEWTQFREDLSTEMWKSWRGERDA